MEQHYLRKSSGCHLYPAFVRGVDLQVVAISAMQAQEATAWKPSIVTLKMVQREGHNHG